MDKLNIKFDIKSHFDRITEELRRVGIAYVDKNYKEKGFETWEVIVDRKDEDDFWKVWFRVFMAK